MGSRAWLSQLQSNEMFQIIRESLPVNVQRTQCILECKHDILYLWNQMDNSILTLNLKNLNDGAKDVACQALVATTPACFDAHALCVSVAATRVCAWGARGALVLELPRRWGRSTSGKTPGQERIFCSSVVIDERFFLMECELRQVRWHLGSSSDSHILLLAADNTIRLYDTSAGYGSGVGAQLLRVLAVGRRPCAPLATMPILASLGHTAVDFDVAPPAPRQVPSASKKALLEWPLLVLRGNGDVYMVDGSIDLPSGSKPKLAGPLTMYPPADDNYGVDSCSLLILGAPGSSTAGVVVAIATTAGMVYHCLLLPDDDSNGYDDEDENAVTKDYDTTLFRSNMSLVESGELTRMLFVVEAIELEIGLILSDNDPTYSCPIYLKNVESCRGQYLCVHEAGVHVINVPLMAELENYINKEDVPVSALRSHESIASYSVCTSTARRPDSANRPLGAVGTNFVMNNRDGSNVLLVLLTDGSVLGRIIEPHHATERLFNNMTVKIKKQPKGEMDSALAELRKVQFEEMIRDIIKNNISQPILKMSSSDEPTLEECLEICSSAHRGVGARLQRHRAAVFELQRRTRVLRTLLQHQKSALTQATDAIESLRNAAAGCKVKSDVAISAQDKINERYFNVSRALRAKNSGEDGGAPPVGAELALNNDLKASNAKMAVLADQLAKVKHKMMYQEKQMHNWEEDRKKKEMYLGQSHTETIKTILNQQNTQIKSLIAEINNLKLHLGIV